MKMQTALEAHGFPPEARAAILSSGITDLYPPQAEAVKKGLLKGRSVLLAIPTAAGKTLMAELCMLHAILNGRGRCLYIAPLKALASEKYKDFHKKYAALGAKVGLAIGDHDTPSHKLNRYNIVVATAEKVDSLLRGKAKWLIDDLSVVVLDEIHFINDGSRGPTMEILTARIKELNPATQLLALSATISNAEEMADWLNAELVQSDWRPIPLREGVYFNGQIEFNEPPNRKILEEARDDVSKLTLDTLRGGGQVLIFVGSRRSAQAVSRQVSGSVAKTLSDDEKKRLALLSKKIVGTGTDATKVCHKLADVVKHGAAFHHAGLKPQQRELIEEHFKSNLIKAISCTPTLAAGVNLPARRAIIRDCKRFEAGLGAAFIPTFEYKQCAGRAGRPQFDEYGEAVLIAKSHSESATLFERYIEADSEPVTSKLANESALRIHILSSIAGGYVYDIKGMLNFISHTFLHHQNLEPNLLDIITGIFDFLHQEKFVEKAGDRFFATPLGALTSRLYIDPFTAIIIRQGLSQISESKPYSEIGILHLMTCTPDCPTIQGLGKDIIEELEHFATHFYEQFLLTPENTEMLDDFYFYLSTIKTTWMLNQWMEEDRDEAICDKFNIGPGDIYRHVDSTQWLLYAAISIADLLNRKPLTIRLENLRLRIRNGIKEDLLELVQLRGIGRVRARQLVKKGILKQKDLQFLSVDQLADIPTIGLGLAKDIKSQLLQKSARLAAQKRPSSDNVGNWDD
ncbi:MAG: DEAD/DEAH box helicase [Candidatus Omnitrophica bacterium]|nr:DEAD/DEAH box helicase [Candidatus Omnitrophota bacterium]